MNVVKALGDSAHTAARKKIPAQKNVTNAAVFAPNINTIKPVDEATRSADNNQQQFFYVLVQYAFKDTGDDWAQKNSVNISQALCVLLLYDLLALFWMQKHFHIRHIVVVAVFSYSAPSWTLYAPDHHQQQLVTLPLRSSQKVRQ